MLGLLFVVSCSTNQEVNELSIIPNSESKAIDVNYQNLQSDLNQLNANIESHKTRGFLSRFFNRVLKVFVSDCVGAIKGAFEGENIWQSAEGASLGSAKKQGFISCVDATNTYITRVLDINEAHATDCLQPKESALQNVLLVDPASATLEDSIGYYHNRIIYNTLQENNSITYWKEISDEECLQKLNVEITKASNGTNYKDTIMSNKTKVFCTFISQTSTESQNYEEIIETTKIKYPQLSNMLDVASTYFKGMELVTTEEEWQQYCKNVLAIITKANISQHDKDALKMGINVGYASSKLWKCE